MNKAVIFDLDDTLYKEIDYLKSAYKNLSKNIANEVNGDFKNIYNKMLYCFNSGENVFKTIIQEYDLKLSISDLLQSYRTHKPSIKLTKETEELLCYLNNDRNKLGLLTDGRSLQQRNKIGSLGLKRFISEFIISEEFGSEKPNMRNYLYFSGEVFSDILNFYYIGDNVTKDFITPNKLGWETICIKDDGKNIHKQDFTLEERYLPKHIVNNIPEILPIILNE